MLFDELIQKHLNGELDEAGRSNLNSIAQSNPDVAETLTSMENLETSLGSFKTQLTENDDIFIRDFGMTLLTGSGASGGGEASGSSKTSFGNFLLNKNIYIVGFLIMAMIGSYYFVGNSKGSTDQTSSSTKNSFPNSISKDNPQPDKPVLENQIQSTEQSSSHIQESKSVQTQNNPSTSRSIVKDEMELSVRDKNNQKNIELINKMKVALDDYSAKGDVLNAALTAKRLGVLYRQLEGYSSESLLQFQRALRMSEESHNQLMKAEVLGELSLLYFKTNQTELGNKTLNQCIDLLIELSSSRVDYWQKIKTKY